MQWRGQREAEPRRGEGVRGRGGQRPAPVPDMPQDDGPQVDEGLQVVRVRADRGRAGAAFTVEARSEAPEVQLGRRCEGARGAAEGV